MAGNGTVDVIIQQQAIDNIAKANAALEVTLKNIIAINEASRKGSSTGNNPNSAANINKANAASTERLKIADQTLVMQKKLVQAEINLSNATTKTNKAIIQNRVNLQQTNKRLKESAILSSKLTSRLQKAQVVRNRLAKTVQDLNVKRNLGNKLTKSEERLLKRSTAQFRRYDSAIKKSKESVNRFQESVGNYQKGLKGTISVFKNLIGVIGVFQALRMGVQFARDAAALAREAKGVDFAFQNLGENGQKAFEDVRASTRGLLSDLSIKKNIILFDNFNISLKQMGDLMEFATVRASQTGESVEHLAQSIATGLGRESVLILDNLGINTKELRNLMNDLGVSMTEAFSILASREVAEAGNILDEATNSQERFNAAFENFKVSAGSGFIGTLTDDINDFGTSMLATVGILNDASDSFGEFILNALKISQGGAGSVIGDAFAKKLKAQRKEIAEELAPALIEMNKQLGITMTMEEAVTNLLTLGTEELKKRVKEQRQSKESQEDLNEVAKKTIAHYNEIIRTTKELRDSTAETNAEYESFNQTILDAENGIQRLKVRFKELIEVQSVSAPGLAPITGGGDSEPVFATSAPQVNQETDVQERLDAEQQIQDKSIETFSALLDLGDVLFERKIALIDAEIQANEEKYNLLFLMAEGDAEQQRLLAIQEEKERQKLDKKRRKEQKKQAIFRKAAAIVEIGINTAIAISSAIATPPAPLGLALAIVVGALGAAQIATVLASPIPQFAKGGTMDKDGLAIVGDGGRKEVIKNPDGSIQVTPNKSTVVGLQKGAEIFPSIDAFNQEIPTDISDQIYSATVMASLSINNAQMKGYMQAQRVLDEKLLDAMLLNTQAIKKQKLSVNNRSQRVDLSHDLYKMRYSE